ncbi:response regulator transcription factor [Amphibacillus cookii]|uniref:response regulator transcription factor n=1 Tax=Amphibacillus cookii TaxID=767787 RepID=UPI00195B9D85|nr:response regulator transcription factor [Amphibacillus cookii]MBM7542272.1 DNA-binding response OmpR family regulator [Amphibacillus cookii]
MKIMLVEDEEMLSAIVAKGLRKVGYAVDTVFNGEEALEYYQINEYDIIVLDLNIPKIDGLDVLRTIRKKDIDTKILILSARAKIDERILGLDEGANDYLIKPFDFGELEARIRNLLRRNFSVISATIMLGSFMIDTNAKKVICNNEALNLTRKEYNIFEYLILNKNRIVSAEQLVEHIWDSEFNPFSNALRYHIHTLKKKLSDFSDKEVIKTIRGQGYIIEDVQ